MTMEITEALKSIQGFSFLNDSVLEQLAHFSSLRPMRAGETIFCQGEPSPYCFGILSGEVAIQHVPKESQFPPKTLSVFGSGDLFGESAVFADSPRMAMASAMKDGCLLAIRGSMFRDWLRKNAQEGQPLLLELLRISLERLYGTSHELSVSSPDHP